ncbi:Hypothetical predicted protein [Paramuricea clavata]|uniref:Uncharacterized protein n=1 Tax=Paramuricea clavata TaxID=317549 RepID=A0A6S7I8C0_PARCT|nr:Hypothetical predicted protein [Paramuricea clavata]
MDYPQHSATNPTGSELVFDPRTGKLRVCRPTAFPNPDHVIRTEIAASAFYAGCFIVSPANDSIIIGETSEGRIEVETMHISCKSDTCQPGHDYGGIIIYQYNGKSEWRTANNTHCKSGYIVIQDTDSENVKKWMKEPGQVHGAVYRNAFGESVTKANVVGEGFAVRNGESKVEKFEINSRVFNNPKDSIHHDHRRRMHELSEHCVGKIVEYWKTAGPSWVRQRNFEVKQLLEDFDLKSIQNDCTWSWDNIRNRLPQN